MENNDADQTAWRGMLIWVLLSVCFLYLAQLTYSVKFSVRRLAFYKCDNKFSVVKSSNVFHLTEVTECVFHPF